MNNRTDRLSRRRFLCKVGVGASASLLVSQSIAQALLDIDTAEQNTDNAQLTKDDLPTSEVDNSSLISSNANDANSQVYCITPTIETRLFASSNVGTNNNRNQLALQRMACAGFKIDNPAITDRQYLRFAGTDSQRASDLQNIATGAIEAPNYY